MKIQKVKIFRFFLAKNEEKIHMTQCFINEWKSETRILKWMNREAFCEKRGVESRKNMNSKLQLWVEQLCQPPIQQSEQEHVENWKKDIHKMVIIWFMAKLNMFIIMQFSFCCKIWMTYLLWLYQRTSNNSSNHVNFYFIFSFIQKKHAEKYLHFYDFKIKFTLRCSYAHVLFTISFDIK